MTEHSPSAPEHDPRLEEARTRLEGITRGLVAVLGVDRTARTLAGCLLGLLVGTAGRAEADRFLSGVLEQLRADHPENWSTEKT